MSLSMGPSALQETLADMGLQLLKTDNRPANLGKSPELLVCERLKITVRDIPSKWVQR